MSEELTSKAALMVVEERPSEDLFKEIASFLRTVGQSSLFDYFGLSTDAEPDQAREAIDTRRRWAQAQQGNAKFQDEARWLLRHHGLLLRVLVERRDLYLRRLEARRLARSIEQLGLFVSGSVVAGVDSVELTRATLAQAQQLGVPEDLAQQQLDQAQARLRAKTLDDGRRRAALSPELLATMHDTVARGDLTPAEVQRVLEEGRRREMSDQALQRVLEAAATRAARRRSERVEGDESATVSLRGSGVRSAREEGPLDSQIRGDAIRDIVDTVRGALMMGVLTSGTLASVQRRGVQLGLDQRTVELVVAEAKQACEAALAYKLNPYGVLGVAPDVDDETLRQAYQSCRRWACNLADISEGTRACVLVDTAWSLVKDPRVRARYDQGAAIRR